MCRGVLGGGGMRLKGKGSTSERDWPSQYFQGC